MMRYQVDHRSDGLCNVGCEPDSLSKPDGTPCPRRQAWGYLFGGFSPKFRMRELRETGIPILLLFRTSESSFVLFVCGVDGVLRC